jgi:hypothetical protein
MSRALILICTLSLTLCGVASAQDDRPLGDVARDSRAAKSSAPKAAKVVTNDEVPASTDQGGSGPLSGEKEAYCEELRRRKDTAAEEGCALLRIDMGSEYEDLMVRAIALEKNLCGAAGGKGLPSTVPKDSQFAAQTRELSELSVRFLDMMKAQTKAYTDAEIKVNAVRKEEAVELSTAAPNWERPANQVSPAERERFEEIDKKYKARIQEKEEAAQRMRARSVRYLVDQGRMQHVCDNH